MNSRGCALCARTRIPRDPATVQGFVQPTAVENNQAHWASRAKTPEDKAAANVHVQNLRLAIKRTGGPEAERFSSVAVSKVLDGREVRPKEATATAAGRRNGEFSPVFPLASPPGHRLPPARRPRQRHQPHPSPQRLSDSGNLGSVVGSMATASCPKAITAAITAAAHPLLQPLAVSVFSRQARAHLLSATHRK